MIFVLHAEHATLFLSRFSWNAYQLIFSTVDLAGAKLLEQGVNIASDAYLAMTVRDGSSLKSALLNNFTPVFNEEIVRQSAIGHLSYFDIFQSQNIVKHIAGAGPTLHPGDSIISEWYCFIG